ncbi:MAG: nickel pincer cofactor biosynthesis protein LarC [Chloroflexi bacterium]|nr:nickel pincer cofactor biosynthesis protein LarC [Chloroflexota bacterium]
MRIAYLDMVGGVSGDMLLGALLDAGLPLESLRSSLDLLNIGGYELSASQVMRGGVKATLAHVDLNNDGNRLRDWAEFERAIAGSALPGSVKTTALSIFDLLARAESAAHGTSKEATHLHELGTADTLVDVAGVVAGLDLLGVEKVHASPFPLSSGTSKSSHGVMAATAAATGEIYRITGASVRAGGAYGPRGEAVTPTGAAIVSTIATFHPVAFTPELKGYGAGSRDPDEYPNVVGLWIGESSEPRSQAPTGLTIESDVCLLETNIDDMSGEMLGYVQERLFQAGALDVWTAPVQMKKGRPAVVLSVLCRPRQEAEIARLILRESTTLGVRRRTVERYVAEREMIRVETPHGEVDVKVKRVGGEIAGIHPEYEVCREIAMRTGLPLWEIVDAAVVAARSHLGM